MTRVTYKSVEDSEAAASLVSPWQHGRKFMSARPFTGRQLYWSPQLSEMLGRGLAIISFWNFVRLVGFIDFTTSENFPPEEYFCLEEITTQPSFCRSMGSGSCGLFVLQLAWSGNADGL